jgi:predicted HAD superfamily Cof-like phosphohydrolase
MTDTFYGGGYVKREDEQQPLTNFQKVGQFMTSFEQEVKTKAEFPSEKVQKLRFDLIDEELTELHEGMQNESLVEIADALTDLLYVVYGAGHAYGIDLDKTFAEVHRSNMTKLGEDGKPIRREDGKVMKSKNYQPPQLAPLVLGEEKVDGVSEGQNEA